MPLINPIVGAELLEFQGALPGHFSAFNESVFDDFTIGSLAQTRYTNRWTSVVSGAGSAIVLAASAQNHPGIIEVRAGTAVAGAAQVIAAYPTSALVLPLTGRWEFRVMVNLAQLSTAVDRFICRVGLSDAAITGDVTDGVYFEYSDTLNGGNWTICAARLSTRSKVNSGVAATAGTYQEFAVRGTPVRDSADFFIDDVFVGRLTSQIPISATNMAPGHMLKSAGVLTRSLFIDYWYYAYSFGDAR